MPVMAARVGFLGCRCIATARGAVLRAISSRFCVCGRLRRSDETSVPTLCRCCTTSPLIAELECSFFFSFVRPIFPDAHDLVQQLAVLVLARIDKVSFFFLEISSNVEPFLQC